ncbi:hypothetical protein HYS29_00565 [Candidatus Microgenomates bacterium]|nr:hypothetical protein [Candidatus Microgenomates bacterium]
MKKLIIFGGVIILFLFLAFTFFNKSQTPQTSVPTSNITASFTIITDKITRSFTNPKYHNQSAQVYIQADNPSIVYVKKTGITWDDFFKTLPMKLTKDCLVTGDGETLCNGQCLPAGRQGGTLKFYLNDIETPDLLDKEIKQNDQILIKFTS